MSRDVDSVNVTIIDGECQGGVASFGGGGKLHVRPGTRTRRRARAILVVHAAEMPSHR